jgi:DNA mismatch repair ATPase MutS
LLLKKAYTIFCTHFIQLTELSLYYTNVKNFHLIVSSQNGNLQYLYNLSEGSTTEDGYGIKLAKMIGFPKQIIENSIEYSEKIIKEKKKKSEENYVNNLE